jgi:hypothetical protein
MLSERTRQYWQSTFVLAGFCITAAITILADIPQAIVNAMQAPDFIAKVVGWQPTPNAIWAFACLVFLVIALIFVWLPRGDAVSEFKAMR